MVTRIICFLVGSVFACAGYVECAAQDEDLNQWLSDAERVVFLGDSITYNGGYVAYFESWSLSRDDDTPPLFVNVGLPSETVSGLSEKGHAGGKFPRPDLAERLSRVLETTEPDLVFACYGINCGIYQPFDEGRFQKYKQGIQNLVDQVEFAGAKLILLTPPIFDDAQVKKDFLYNDVMIRYSKWLIAEGKKQEWQVIDVNTAMADALRSARATRPDYTFQPDGVHPNAGGHWCMAQALIKKFDPNFDQSSDLQGLRLQTLKRRLDLYRDSYLTASGHKRPGLQKGLTLAEAKNRAEEITGSLKSLERYMRGR